MSDNGYYGSSAHPEDRHDDDRMETDERDRQMLQQAADQDRAAQAPRSRSRSRSAERGAGDRDRDRDRDRDDRRAADSSRSPVRRDSRDRERETRRPEDDQEVANPGNQLYVRGLSFRTTEPELRDLFGKYGELTEVNVVKDPHLNECRGFAFVKYANPEDAASAIKGEHDQDFHGRRLIVELSRRAKPRPKTPGEYLGRLSTREMELRGDRRRRTDDRDRPYGRGSYGGDRGYDRGGYDDRERGYGGRGGRGYDERDRYDRYDDRSGGNDRAYGGGARGGAGGRGGYDDRDYGRRY